MERETERREMMVIKMLLPGAFFDGGFFFPRSSAEFIPNNILCQY